MSDITPILEELAAGRIDAAEANRRIEALKARQTAAEEPVEAEVVDAPEADPEPAEEPEEKPRRAASDDTDTQRDEPQREGWEGGRPQFATHTRDFIRRAASGVQDAAARAKASAQAKPSTGTSDADALGAAQGVERVVIRSTGQRVRVIGDPAVSTLTADGPHVLRRTGKVLEVTGNADLGPSLKGFSVVRPPKSLDDLRTIGLGRELVVRVNPAFVLDVEVLGSSLRVTDVPVLGRVRVTAGGATLTGVREVQDALVQAGSATVEGPVQQGRSRIRVESGNLTMTLEPKSNVTVKAEAQIGKVIWPIEGHRMDEYVLGNGSARLDLVAVMGRVVIRQSPEPASTEKPDAAQTGTTDDN